MASLLPKRFVQLISFENNTFLLTGDGGKVLLFEYLGDRWLKIGEQKVFDRANVYGFSRFGSTLCFFGEKYFTFGDISNGDSDSKTLKLSISSTTYFTADWIWQALFFDSFKIAFLTGHNKINIFNMQLQTVELSVQCDENCVLYSGILLGSNFSDLCVIAGSVFNEILLWTPSTGTHILHRLRNHEGVVFGLDFCPIRKLLCSTSDDRSCRVWKFEFSKDLTSTWPLPVSEWNNGSFVQLHDFYGHEARVWKAIWIPASVMDDALVTVGEDGCINLWDCTKGLLRSWKTSRGSIRSVCFDESSKDLICGSDSGSLFSIQLCETSSKLKRIIFPEKLLQDEGIVELCFCNEALLCISNKGYVAVYDEEHGTKPIVRNDNLRYTCLHKSDQWIAVGGLNGTVCLFNSKNPSSYHHHTICSRKICSIHFIHDGRTLLCCTADGRMLVYEVDKSSGQIVQISLTFELPEGKHRWLTCALVLGDDKTLVGGDRNGSVCFYEVDFINGTLKKQTIFPKVHGSHGVTDLRQHSTSVVFSIGRDGIWRQWHFVENEWTLATASKVGNGFEWPSKFLLVQDKLLIAGFKGNKFTLYYPENRQYLCDVDCGGGHRSCDMKVQNDSNCVSFLFAKTGEILLAEADLGNEKEIIPSFHTRHVKQIISCTNNSQSDSVFATCSEDSTIAVWCLKEGELVLLQRLKGQMSSVHCLISFDCFLISGGGRSEICLWQKKTDEPYILVARDLDKDHADARYLAMNLIQIDSSLLLSTVRSDGLVNFFIVAIESKIISKLSNFARADCCLTKLKFLSTSWCFVVGTNGNLFVLNLNNLDFTFESSTSCKSNLEESKKKKNRTKKRQLNKCHNNVTERQLSWHGQISLADNGLTSLDVRWFEVDKKLSDRTALCIYGCESGLLSVAIISLGPSVSCLRQITCSPIHASTVVDVLFTSQNYLLSLSIDQRICIWHINQSEGDIDIKFSESFFSHVSDPSSFCCLKTSKQALNVVIAGSGLQILNVK